jgi:predicted helicase
MSKSIFENYIHSISTKFSYDETSEMGYRTDFEILLKGIFESINVKRFDHDAKASKGNKPDFVVRKHDVPILYIEAKNIGESLDKIEKSEQMSRYFGYTNLVLTNYVEFRFYRNGVRYEEPIKIATYDLKHRIITSFPQNYEHATKTLLDFTQSHKEPIRSGKHLAKIMGGKAQRIRNNIRHFFSNESDKDTDLMKLYETIKKLLVHDLTPNSFADMYAQTLVYGLFVARYYDKSLSNFSRQEARELIPNSNPLLRHFFDHIVGADFDARLKYIVDELCEVFSHANVQELMKEYFKQDDLWGKTHEGPDPVIHFYEDFLEEYDPGLRKKMGAYYTPLPIVNLIVRSVDYLLKKEFGIIAGLADTSKTTTNIHKVQILDPAVGTGTFISAVIRIIYEGFLKSGQKGRWPTYVHNDLLPRLHGFELMMAPYTIAHLKLGIAFRQTGFWDFHRRLGIYLTNSLEKSSLQQDMFSFGLAESIAEESKEASVIKNNTPIMVIIGNPPYSVSSSNKGEWIQSLIKDYKTNLKERNIQPLSDDYIKFIRFAEYFVEKNGSGIVAMITNNSFLDGIIHRQMRKHLLETFNDIYILNLHGNSKKKEKALDGGKDENVFDIQQGVAISIFVRKESKKTDLGVVHYVDLYGNRIDKFEKLNEGNIQNIKWKKLDYLEPYYFFTPKDFGTNKEYEKGWKLDELFTINTSGIKTHHDDALVSFNKFEDNNYQYLYRLFDTRWIEYDLKKVIRHRFSVMRHLLKENIALLTCRQQSSFDFQHVFVSKILSDICSVSLQTKESTYVFPLYLYSENGSRVSNFKKEIVDKIEKIVGKVSPENIFDYIYSILHSPNYRKKYKEFLKIDFPRIPYPKDTQSFRKLVSIGAELQALHLMESSKLSRFITTYPEDGSNVVEKPIYKNGNVYINEKQYFGKVPELAWNFYIGGYQPAQKWLKDRKGRTLTNEELEHYQKIIVVLVETDRLMSEIDGVLI